MSLEYFMIGKIVPFSDIQNEPHSFIVFINEPDLTDRFLVPDKFTNIWLNPIHYYSSYLLHIVVLISVSWLSKKIGIFF